MATNDPDELQYELAIRKKDPAVAIRSIEEIEIHLNYGISSLKFIGWIVVILLTFILWRIW